MGVEVRRGPSFLAITVPILIMLLHAHICRAVSPVSGNSSTSGSGRCNSDQGEWLVGDIASEEDFLMASEINRRMLGSIHITDGSQNAKKAAVSCGQGNPYNPCLHGKNPGGQPKEHCGIYKRKGCR